jgi:nitronate monooxygenase
MERLSRVALNSSRNKLFNDNREAKFPIIQAPMAGGILSAETIAKIANSGFFVNIASGYLGINGLQK